MALRWKLLLWIGMPVMLIYLMVLGLEYRHLRSAALEHVSARCTLALARQADSINTQLQLTSRSIEATADVLARTNADEAALRTSAEQLLTAAALVTEVEIARDGSQPARIRLARDGTGVRAVPLDRTPPFAAGWTTTRKTDGPRLPHYATKAVHDNITITVRATLAPRGLAASLSEVLAGQGQPSLVDADARYVWHPDAKLLASDTSMLEHAVQSGHAELVSPLQTSLTQARTAGPVVAKLPATFTQRASTWFFYAPLPAAGWTAVAMVPEQAVLGPVYAHVQRTALIMLAGVALVLTAVWLTSRRLTQPLSELARQSKLLMPEANSLPTASSTARDASRLTLSLDMISNNVREAKMRIASETARRETAEGELRVARRMQESLLPQPLAADTLRPFGLSLHAVNLPAAEVAGDFFDHFIDARGRLVVSIADVSGKGASAAMLMAVTRTALRGAADGAEGPADIVRSINRFLLENTHDTVSFVTMIVLLIHRDGTMAYSNAGHPPAVCLCDQRAPLDIAPGTGTVVGIVPEDEAPAGQASLTLPADWTRLVFVTDGVLEAAHANARQATAQPRDMFGLARLHTLLASHSRTPASEICDAIVRAVQTFEGANRGDDVTVLVIARESTP